MSVVSSPTNSSWNFAKTRHGSRIKGVDRRRLDLPCGCFALLEHEFTLVPWRSVLERSLGGEGGRQIASNV
jgi:hypothetical protein